MGKRAKVRSPDNISRREFFQKSISLAAALGVSGLVSGPSASSAPSASGKNSRALVILAKKTNRGNDLREFYGALLKASLRRLAKTERSEDAWARFFGPDDAVAIKVNSITGERLSTSPALVTAIV